MSDELENEITQCSVNCREYVIQTGPLNLAAYPIPEISLSFALGKIIYVGVEMVWLEIETQVTAYKVRTFRGLADEQKVAQLLSGNDQGFLQLDECYWYNDADDQDEEEKTLASYQKLGSKEYLNFTGSICIRCSTIINVSFLKGGFNNEPIMRCV